MKEYKVNKIEVSRRQANQAIKLFFFEQDEISIHTLAGATHQILRDIVGRERSMAIYDNLVKGFKPKARKGLIKTLNKPKNFFKHADKDKDKSVIFRPKNNEFLLYDITVLYEQETGQLTDLMKIFRLWFNVTMGVSEAGILPELENASRDRKIFFNTAKKLLDCNW